MRKVEVTCDLCKEIAETNDEPVRGIKAQTGGRNWSTLTLSGSGYDKDNKYINLPQRRLDICPDCFDGFKPKDAENKVKLTPQEVLEQAATDWMEELAINAIEQAQENM